MTTKKREEMQRNIISCSKKLFEINGYANTSIRMIAKEVGFQNQASFYIYFESKDKMTAIILRRGAQKVQQYIENLNLKNASATHKLLLENLIVTEILRDEFNRRFYTEAQAAQSFTNFFDQIPDYTINLYSKISNEVFDITLDEVKLNLFSYIKGVCYAFQAIDSKESSVSFDSYIKRLPYVFLELMGVAYHKQKKIIEETQEIFKKVSEEDVKSFYFFNE